MASTLTSSMTFFNATCRTLVRLAMVSSGPSRIEKEVGSRTMPLQERRFARVLKLALTL